MFREVLFYGVLSTGEWMCKSYEFTIKYYVQAGANLKNHVNQTLSIQPLTHCLCRFTKDHQPLELLEWPSPCLVSGPS
jgi:hypothetical protein